MPKKEKRFIKTYSQDMGAAVIYVDRKTGVNYLYVSGGYSGGLTPLLNPDGRPVVTSIPKEPEE